MAGSSARELLRSLWRERSNAWLRYALSKTADYADAEDIVQDAVFRTLQANPVFDSRKEANAHILKAISTSSSMLIRLSGRRARLRERLSTAGALSRQVEASALLLSIGIEDDDEAARLHRRAIEIFRELPEKEREAAELTLLHDPPLTLREVAEAQGVVQATVHYRIKRAVAKVAAILNKELTKQRDEQ